MEPNFLNITWNRFCFLGYLLSHKIKTAGNNFDLIITIARGGLTISQILSDSLKLPIASFTVQSYKDLKQDKLPHITYGLSADLSQKRILLCDDICDTGKTFERGLAYLNDLGVDKTQVKTCCLHFKPHSSFKPNYFVEETSAWVIYPYEVRETMEQVYPLWKKQNISSMVIKERFLSWEFPKKQVEDFLNQH